jgi:dTDP-4-amino-4,6-dideoxygalactose transaminase
VGKIQEAWFEYLAVPIARKLTKLLSYRFQVPWCVPAWGWGEFRATLFSTLRLAVRRGRKVQQFADAVTGLLGRQYAVPVGRGRDAIVVALRALDIQSTDEVVLPSYICSSVLDAVIQAGGLPVFADVDESLHVTVRTVESVLTPRTRCVIVPHLFGNTAPVDEIEALLRGRGIPLIDDAAQGFGAQRAGQRIGTFGQFGIVCGGPGKPLAAAAGALLLMDDPELHRNVLRMDLPVESAGVVLRRTLSFWFWRRFRRYPLMLEVILWRFSSDSEDLPTVPHGLANLDAAVLCEQLDQLEANKIERRQNARALLRILEPLQWKTISDFGPDAIPLKLIMLLPESGPDMNAALDALAQAGIECQAGYPPCHWKIAHLRQPILPGTEALWNRVLCLPIESRPKNPEPLIGMVQSRLGGAVPRG